MAVGLRNILDCSISDIPYRYDLGPEGNNGISYFVDNGLTQGFLGSQDRSSADHESLNVSDRGKKMDILGSMRDVVDVPMNSATEFFNEYILEDGTVIKVKNVATSFLRVEGKFLPDGRPIYLVLSAPVVSVESSPVTKKVQ
jgi:hypothetical protein